MVARCEQTSSVHGSGEPTETKRRRIAEKAVFGFSVIDQVENRVSR
jgi:hypothetical protein